MEFSGADDGPNSHRRRKHYHRHTAHQIQRLEAIFKECQHPDEKTRNQLSRDLNLSPRQIKFWFQNTRTQMKAQHERSDNCVLRSENDKIRCANIAMGHALENAICPSCGTPPISEDPYLEEQRMRIENAHLKQELDRISSITAKYIGRPISQLPPILHHHHVSSLDLSMATSFGATLVPNLPFPPMTTISDMDKSLMADVAANAMDELIRLLQSNEPLWIKSDDRQEKLNLESYSTIFQSPYKNPNVRTEASRDSRVVIMSASALVAMFMDANKWEELFPTIVTRARTIEVISSGMLGSQSGTLQLMYEELQVLSALVPTRQVYFLRFCQQIKQGSWAIVDVSYDVPHQESQNSSSPCITHKLPSGCLIQDMPNGYSKVTWVEHWEVEAEEDKAPIHELYRDLIHSGRAFGAERWLSTLERTCERYACLMVSGNLSRDLGGVIPSAEGKRSMMKLAERMVKSFCCCINPCNGQQWTTISGTDKFEIRATLHKSTDPGQPNGVIMSAAATICLPIPPQDVFNFFTDERTRSQWDVLSNQNPVQEVAHIANGSHPGNCISLLRAFNTGQSNMLILQESCIDSWGSIVVYCPVDLPAINTAMSGEDPSRIPLLPSGFAISRDGVSTGSLITIVFQILVSNLPSARMTPESVTTVNNLIGNSVHQIKTALDCNSTTTS